MFEAYLDAIFKSTYKDFELILVDDGSQEDLQSLLKNHPVVLKKLDHRRGSYYARNIGAQLAKGEILFFIDADIQVRSETLQNTIDIFNRYPDVPAVIGSYDDDPAAKNTVSQFKFLHHHYVHQHGFDYLGSFWTGYGAVKKEIFQRLGGFNCEIFNDLNAVNDIDFGYRLKINGYKVYNARSIQVKHLKRLSFMDWVKTDIFKRGLPWLKILVKYRDFSPTLNVNLQSFLSIASVGLMVIFSLGSIVLKSLFSIVPLLGIMFLIFNFDFLRFLANKRGFIFALYSIPLLFIYYLNCGFCVLFFSFIYKRI